MRVVACGFFCRMFVGSKTLDKGMPSLLWQWRGKDIGIIVEIIIVKINDVAWFMPAMGYVCSGYL
jgi:hypothetical protein